MNIEGEHIYAPEIWGGIECTINRVGNQYLDQLEFSNYYKSDEDLDAVIGLGIKTLRYPVLWEKHQPDPGKEIDWRRTESQLNKLKENRVTPIVGLLHHGSGPVYTDLTRPDFPELLAAYARKIAAKFPWINYYTPINEPLTTARFSGLYGLWYPHKKNDVTFIKILLNELKGIVLSMHEIKKINPAAKLVQTEDLGKTYSTPLLQYQATFENHRRWLTYDLLTGCFNESHPLWKYFMRLGIDKKTLEFFIENPYPPDIIGINYYLTSERYLDEQLFHYPFETHGGNGLHQYADVEAVRVPVSEPHGLEVLLKEIWERYNIPLVISETHLHCSREEQLRWINYVFETAINVRKNKIDLRAVTFWALLGSFGWNKLLTGYPCEYETGAFDISAGYPRPTALAVLIKDLLQKNQTKNSLFGVPGWWQRDSRYFKINGRKETVGAIMNLRPLIIIGKNGTLGRAFAKICVTRNIFHYLLGRDDVNICNSVELENIIIQYHPWGIINAAGFVNVDEAETEKEKCYRHNTLGVQKLAILCEKHQIKLMSFSSDLVFDGKKKKPYKESDLPNALNTYGHSKILAESFLINVNPSSLIIRTSAFFGPWDEFNFISITLAALFSGKFVKASNDIIISPTYVPHLVQACLDLLIDDASGIWHLVNDGCLSWYEFARKAALCAGADVDKIIAVTEAETLAKRPAFSALTSEKYSLMPKLEDALDQYCLHKYALVRELDIKKSL